MPDSPRSAVKPPPCRAPSLRRRGAAFPRPATPAPWPVLPAVLSMLALGVLGIALAAAAAPTAPVAPAVPGAPGAAPPAGGLEAELTRMARIGGCWSPSFSPDGLSLAFVSNQSGVPQVWTVASDGVRQERVTNLDDPVGRVEWSPDGRFLAFTLAPGGGMNSQVYLVRPDGQQLVRVGAQEVNGKANNLLDGFSHDGRLLLLSSNRDAAAALEPFTYEVATGAWRRIAPGGGYARLSDVSRDGRYGLIQRVRQRGDEDVSIVELQTGRETLLTPHRPPASFGPAVLAPDGMTVYLASNQDRDLQAFARLRLARLQPGGQPAAAAGGGSGGGMEVLAARADAELDDFALTEDGHTAALLWNAAGRSQLSFFDLDSHTQEPGPALPGEVVRDLAFSRNGRLLALTIQGPRLPADVWVVDRATNRLRQVTHSAHDGVDLAALVSPELVRFPALDGLELSGWLYRPAGTAAFPEAGTAASAGTAGGPPRSGRPAPGPVVLSFHGGPEAQERPHFDPLYQALLARGIGVFAPNVRGSAGFGKRFVNLDNGALRVGAVRDIRAAVEYLVREGIADPRRVGIVGGSYGGYMTMAGLTEFPELFAAGADLYGIVNFETFFANTEPWMAAISKLEYGDPATQRDMLRALSPIHKLDRVRAPTLLLHGANDTNVPVIEAEQVVQGLERRGVPVQLVLFADEGHGFRKIANRIRSTTAIVRWFETYLGPIGAPPAAGHSAGSH